MYFGNFGSDFHYPVVDKPMVELQQLGDSLISRLLSSNFNNGKIIVVIVVWQKCQTLAGFSFLNGLLLICHLFIFMFYMV